MEIFWWIIGILWIAGWLKELAFTHWAMNYAGISYPYEAIKYVMPIMLFFLWPYFYFYGKR